MTSRTQPSGNDWTKKKPTEHSHRWIVHVLAEMVHYAEAHELEAVTSPLMIAIEEIAPMLACTADTPLEKLVKKPSTNNVIGFHRRNLD